MQQNQNVSDGYIYILEFRVEDLSKEDCNKVLEVLKQLHNVKYKEFSKKELPFSKKTSI